jgi:uncharacterized protein YxeA
MKPKILLYILIAIAIIAVGAFIIYQLVYRGNNNAIPTGQTGSLPSAANQQFPSNGQTSTVSTFNTSGINSSSSKFGIISNDPALDYFVDAANTVTLIKPDGTIESIANNKTSVISGSAISNIISTAFSYDGKKALVTSRVGTTTQSSIFNLASQIWTRLPDGMQNPVWSPTDYQVAYFVPSNSGSETLTTINIGATTTKPVSIISLAMEDMMLQWPNKNTLVISDRPSAYTTGSIWLFSVSSKALFSAAYEDLGVESLWGASGSALIFSAEPNNAGGQLAFRNATGTQKVLSFATLPSKCTFGPSITTSSTTNPSGLIYCAVPSDQTTFSVARLPDEYDQGVYFTNDDLYSINTGTGSLAKIFSSSAINQNLDATHMEVFNNVLFFINRYDQKIYALSL